MNKKGTKKLYFTHMPRSRQWMDLYQIWFRGRETVLCAVSRVVDVHSVVVHQLL